MDPSRVENVILVADDDEDDCWFVQDSLKENGWTGGLRFVHDGIELMDYLQRCEPNSNALPCPDLILLDLNMPRKDGREVLREIKADPNLSPLPIIVLTTSNEKQDMELCAQLGVISFITKPAGYDEWVKVMGDIRASFDDHGAEGRQN